MDAEYEIEQLKESVRDLERAVFKGNGHPSLISRAEATDEALRNMRQDISSIKGGQGWAVRLIVGQTIVYLLSILWKHLPL